MDVEAESKAYMYVLPHWEAFQEFGGKAILQQAKTALARACTTKAEALLCQCLSRSTHSKKNADRMLSITAELSSRTHTDWRQMVQADLVAACDEVLGKHATSATKAQ